MSNRKRRQGRPAHVRKNEVTIDELPADLRRQVERQNDETDGLARRSALAAAQVDRADQAMKQHQMLHNFGVDHEPCEKFWMAAHAAYAEQAECFKLSAESIGRAAILEEQVIAYIESRDGNAQSSDEEMTMITDLLGRFADAADELEVENRIGKPSGDIS